MQTKAGKGVLFLVCFLFLFVLYQYRSFHNTDCFVLEEGSYRLVSSETQGNTQEVSFIEQTDSSVVSEETEMASSTEKTENVSEGISREEENPVSEPEDSFSGASQSVTPETGLVNLNTADSETLQTLKGIGPKTAEKILDYREKAGGFDTIEDLMNVSGIGEKTFAKLKPYITVE